MIHGRLAASELLRTALAPFGLVPLWPSSTLNVLADATRLASSADAAPLLEPLGGLEGLQRLMQAEAKVEAPCKACASVAQVGDLEERAYRRL